MKRFLLLINLLVCFAASSQTTLERGDVMVLGVNANNSCESLIPEDYLHLVFFKAVTTNTEFHISDNRFAGSNFATTEGTLLVKRTGGTLAAGTVVKIGVLNNGTGTATGWSVTKATSGANFNLNTTGDQFLLWQGTWNGSNGNYTGNFLVGYNSKRDWITSVDSNNSIIPNDLTCYHISAPTTSNLRYRYYQGPITSVSQGEWLVRILNKDRWRNDLTNATGCGIYNTYFSTFPSALPIETTIPSQEICSGETLTDLEVVNETNVVQYQWYENTTASTVGGTLIPGATTFTHTPSNTAIGMTYYYCEMIINLPLNGTNNTTDCAFTSNFFEVTVNLNPVTSAVTPL